MTLRTRTAPRPQQRGQTLVIALIVLGLLLILGFVFLGIVNGNLKGAARSQTRTVANDLAEAGIRYAHGQLQYSPDGADWRGTPTPPVAANSPDMTLDPDAYYTRPADRAEDRPATFNGNQVDLGGPDGLGPFVRINFPNGRALVRVRYAPSDANVLNASPYGALRNPGVTRNYLIIESIGRPGVINPNDPTTLATGQPVQFQGFSGGAPGLQAGLSVLRRNDAQYVNSRRLLAFASIGIIDAARFETNRFNVSRPVEIGVPSDLGLIYTNPNGTTVDVGSNLSVQLGQTAPGTTTSVAKAVPPGSGSLISNADLKVYGSVTANLNDTLGDRWQVSGQITADPGASLTLNKTVLNRGTGLWETASATVSGGALNSRNSQFTTQTGLLVDGVQSTDAQGYSRGIGRLEPPSILTVDPESKDTRYRAMTRNSGVIDNVGVNTGQYGYGRGVYVDNVSDRQEPASETGRANVGGQESLVYDWLNPNNGQANSGWQGPLYVPKGAVVQLLNDGFTIQRTTGAWKAPGGSQAGATVRYRLGTVNGVLRVIDSVNSADINANAPDFSVGRAFNGVLYFEGNVRVRGVIPTDVQLTLVSNATIYIEGSILKGVEGNAVTQGAGNENLGVKLARPSRSTLMLMAKDNVAVNPTQFTGTYDSSPTPKLDQPNATGFNGLVLTEGAGVGQDSINLLTEFALNPNSGTVGNPSSWLPFAGNYQDAVTGNPLPTSLMLSHAKDNDAGEATFLRLSINPGAGAYGTNTAAPIYYFQGDAGASFFPQDNGGNAATDYLNFPQDRTRFYALGRDAWQAYPKFESRQFPLLTPGATGFSSATGYLTSTQSTANRPDGNSGQAKDDYILATQASNDLTLTINNPNNITGSNYVLGRAQVVPGDVRIEASIYAEQGSFFVIPGPWFNPNPDDTRAIYLSRVSAVGVDQADRERVNAYGSYPEMPFYDEPVDVHVVVVGAVSENMPPPMSTQAEWIRKWGWTPRELGALQVNGTPVHIPRVHYPANMTDAAVRAQTPVVPNLVIQYDPVLATGRTLGFTTTNDPNEAGNSLIRTDEYGRALPPMPRLPVSPALAYFGEIQ